MIAAISFIRKRADMTVQAYRKHWLEVHGPLAAALPGVRRYVQSHVIESSATNALARSLGIDGIAQLWLDDEEARVKVYDSEQEKICDVDSLLWIGASARVVTEFSMPIPAAAAKPGAQRFKQISLILDKAGALAVSPDLGVLRATPGVQGLVAHTILKQGAAPTQKRERIGVSVSALYELSFDSLESLERGADAFERAASAPGRVASFATEDFQIV